MKPSSPAAILNHMLCLTENQHPYRTNNIQPAPVWSVMLEEKKGSNSLKWIKSSTFLCLSGTALAGKLRRNIKTRLHRNGSIHPSYPKHVNTILFIKHCAKVLKNKDITKWNIWTSEHFPYPSEKHQKTKLRKEKKTKCTVNELNIHNGVTGVCVCVFMPLYKV